MIKKIFSLTILLLFFSLKSFATGQMVYDLKADIERKTNNMKMFLETANQTKQLYESIKNGNLSNSIAKEQVKALTENLNRLLGFDRSIDAEVKKNSLQTKSFVFLKDRKTGRKIDNKTPQGVEKLIDQIVPKRGTKNRKNYQRVKNAFGQRSAKSSLESAELYIQTYPDKLQEFSDIAMKGNETKSLKDSVDVNNRLIAELLMEQAKTNLLIAKMMKLQALKNFTGEDHNAKMENYTDAERSGWKYKRMSR